MACIIQQATWKFLTFCLVLFSSQVFIQLIIYILRRCKCILVVVFHLFIHKLYEFPLPSNHHPGLHPPSSSFSTLVTSQSSSISFSLRLSVCIYVHSYLVIYHDEYDEEQVQNQNYFYLLSCFSFRPYCCWCFLSPCKFFIFMYFIQLYQNSIPCCMNSFLKTFF